jgi:hypothetical protein
MFPLRYYCKEDNGTFVSSVFVPSDQRHHTLTLILRVIYAVPEATTLL